MDPIYVTKTFLPPLEEFVELLEEMWQTHLVTNDGPLFQRFEQALRERTGMEHLVCVANGTLALQIAVRALGLEGEVITTPFTHVAGSDCLVWEGCKPVYVDIDPDTLNIDPAKIEAKITERTTGIVAVHVYSNPCDVEAIQRIADRRHLRVLYDGAHAFGAKLNGRSVFAYGDMSMASFNATKAFHTMEGGGLFCRHADMVRKVRKLAYYGMDENKEITQQEGTNAKLIEVCAAMGLINLRHFDNAVRRRKEIYDLYTSQLAGNTQLRFQKTVAEINYSYMPVVFKTENLKTRVIAKLNEQAIYPREYFRPSLETVFSDRIDCEIAYDISRRVLCLPMSDYLTPEEVTRICNVIGAAC